MLENLMGRTKGPYRAEFEIGEKVQIADREFLLKFISEWKYHHPLQPEQLAYADQIATVQSVGFYHGGDEVYTLFGISGIWNEECLRSTDIGTNSAPTPTRTTAEPPSHLKEFLTYGFSVKTPTKNRVIYSEGWRRVTMKSDPAGSQKIAIFTDTIKGWELPFGCPVAFWHVTDKQRQKIISRISKLLLETYGIEIELDDRKFD
jgi:hypothetical protein